jgi:hypothetical protein
VAQLAPAEPWTSPRKKGKMAALLHSWARVTTSSHVVSHVLGFLRQKEKFGRIFHLRNFIHRPQLHDISPFWNKFFLWLVVTFAVSFAPSPK